MAHFKINPRFAKSFFVFLIYFLFVFLISYFLFFSTKEHVKNIAFLNFELEAIELNTHLQIRLNAYVDTLYSARGLFYSSEQVTRDEWANFIGSSGIYSRFPGVQVMGYNPIILAEEKDAYVKGVQNESSAFIDTSDFAILPEGVRETYVIADYLYPYEGNEQAFGFDVYSNSVRAKAMTIASLSGSPVASGPIRLVQETGEQKGFLVFLPVYTNFENEEYTFSNTQGYIVAVFRAGDLLSYEIDVVNKAYLNITIVDVTDPDHEFVYDNLIDNMTTSSHELFFEREITVAGRKWSIMYESDIYQFTTSSDRALPILYASIFLLLASILFIVLLAGDAVTRLLISYLHEL
jgi:CHASE1-domain containing sensor protein